MGGSDYPQFTPEIDDSEQSRTHVRTARMTKPPGTRAQKAATTPIYLENDACEALKRARLDKRVHGGNNNLTNECQDSYTIKYTN